MDADTIPLERGQVSLVPLDADHPGFRDAAYRRRRNEIAAAALRHRRGTSAPRIVYTPEEEAVWALVWKRLRPLHELLACRQILEAQDRLALHEGPIPQLADLSEELRRSTGFRMEPVAGLVEARAFLEPLADGVFLSTQYLRHPSRPFYTPEPDLVHEAVGHAASLTLEPIARLHRAFGRAAREADDDALVRLERVYWRTLEFGRVREGGRTKALGAGLLSSVEEIARKGPSFPFDLDLMAAAPYDPTDLQPHYAVAPSFDALVDALLAWLERGGFRR